MSQRKLPSESAAAYAGLISQLGCSTSIASIIIIGLAFGAGRLLDNYLGTDGVFTVLLLVGSFPVTLYVILRISLSTAARAQRLLTPGEDEKSEKHGEDSDT